VAARLLTDYRRPIQVRPERGEKTMFLVLFFVLLVVWVLCWAAFHVAGGLIHLLLLFAVISIIVHLFTGRRAV